MNTNFRINNKGLIEYPVTWTITSDDYCKKLQEFWKACKVIGLNPYDSATIWHDDIVVAVVYISRYACYPTFHNRVQKGDTLQLYVAQKGELV